MIPRSSPASSENVPHGISNDLPDHKDRRALHFLPGGWSEGRAGIASATRASVILAHVRAALRQAVRSLSFGRAGLPWLWAQRLAGPEDVRLHIRSLR